MKRLLYITTAFFALTWTMACKHIDDEPELNSGYETQFYEPDPEPMTAEDSAIVAAQKLEYEQNAR